MRSLAICLSLWAPHSMSRRFSLCLLFAVQNELMSLVDFPGEVRVIRQKLFEVNSGVVIQKHTSNSWSIFVAQGGLNVAIDAISYEFVSSSTLKVLERLDINWLGELDHLHLWCCWLLLLHLLLVNLSWCLWRLRHGLVWLSHVLSLVVIVTSLASSSLVLVLTTLMVLVLVSSSTTTSTSVATSVASPVVVLATSVSSFHVVLINIASLVRLHWLHLLHLVDIPVLSLLNINELNDVLNRLLIV